MTSLGTLMVAQGEWTHKEIYDNFRFLRHIGTIRGNPPWRTPLPNVLRLRDVSARSSEKEREIIYIGPRVPHNFLYYKNTTENQHCNIY